MVEDDDGKARRQWTSIAHGRIRLRMYIEDFIAPWLYFTQLESLLIAHMRLLD
jgi:hypothetical protein